LSAFGSFLGVSNPEHIVMACQMFGSVDLSTMINNLEPFVNSLILKADKNYKPTKEYGSKSKNAVKIDVKCYQPNPRSKRYQFWNFCVVLLAVVRAVIVPLELIEIIERDNEFWYLINILSDSLFLVDIVVSMVTPYYDRRQNRFVVNDLNILSNYMNGWLVPGK
jgi:hypothetical protein